MGFKIVTWNVNGLRSFGGVAAWKKLFTDFDADLVCFQETKISRSSLEEWMAFVQDYSSYFSLPIRSQLQNSGYSGVATFCRESADTRPHAVETTLMLSTDEIFPQSKSAFEFIELVEDAALAERWPKAYDAHYRCGLPPNSLGVYMWKLVDGEGRCVVTKHRFTIEATDDELGELSNDELKQLFVFNVYCPRNDCTRAERQHFQLRFYHMLEKRAMQLLNESANNYVIIVGDLNTTFGGIDVYDDTEWNYANSNSRKWLNDLLAPRRRDDHQTNDTFVHFYDAFRHLHPDEKNSFTCWNTMLGCRATNFGSRLDYILIDHKLLPFLVECRPLTDYPGSDHCPVVAQFDDRIRFVRAEKFSSHCTKMWPEFGRGAAQTTIKCFFSYGTREQVIAQMQQQSPKKDSVTKRTVAASNNNNNSSSSSKSSSPRKKAKRGRLTNNKSSPNSQRNISNYFSSFKKSVKNATTSSSSNDSSSVEVNVAETVTTQQDSNNNKEVPNTQVLQSSSLSSSSSAWKALFKAETPPKCLHGLPCIKRKSTKIGPRQGREFFACPKTSIGPADHPESRCKFFRWTATAGSKRNFAHSAPNGTTINQDDILVVAKEDEEKGETEIDDDADDGDIIDLTDKQMQELCELAQSSH